MGNGIRIAVLVAAAALSVASMGTQGAVSGHTYRPSVTQTEGVSDDDLYAATLRIFDDQGWQIRDKDRDAGIVTTKFMGAGLSSTADQVTHAWRVRIAEGSIRVEIDCMILLTSGGGLRGSRACEGEARDDAWTAKEPELRGKIIADAKMRAAKRAQRSPGSAP